jgi:hypothetical protein
MSTSTKTNGATGVAETNGQDAPQDTTGEGVDLHKGVQGDGCAIPTGWKRNSLGLAMPGDEMRRKDLEEEVAKRKEELKSARATLTRVKKIRQSGIDNTADVVKHEAVVEEIQGKVREAETQLRTLPPEVIPDDQQPWFGKIYANGTGYYIEDGLGGWTPVTEENAKRELRSMGIRYRPDTETTSPLDRALLAIQKRHKVDYAGPLAGYKAGVTEQNGMTILVTSTTKLIQPVEGDSSVINAILDGLLRERRVYFDTYAKVTYEGLSLCLEKGKNTPGPVLVLAGPKHCGKSLLQYHVLTPLLGGKLARPYLFMSGQTSFNGELAGAGHHMLEDEVPAKDISARRKFGNYIKKAAANKGIESHGKQKDIKNLFPFTRLSVSVNDDEECLEVLPPMEDHLTDKLLILKCHKFQLPMPADTPAEQAALEAAIERARPAYIYWLLNVFQIPESIKEGGRGGFKVMQDPEILEKINGTAPELQLRELLEHLYMAPVVEEGNKLKGRKWPTSPYWLKMGSAQEVFITLTEKSLVDLAGRKTLPSIRTCGTYLSRLAEKYPEQFRRYRGYGGIFKYEMKIDPERMLEMLKEEGYDANAYTSRLYASPGGGYHTETSKE